MARLFQTEKSRMKILGQQPSFQTDEAEFLRDSLTVKKQSLLPTGNLHIILCIFNGNMISKHKKILVFQSLMKKTMVMMKKKMTKKMKITNKNGDEDEYKESTPSEVF